MTGQELYALWCDAPGSDREAYWLLMNPADKRHWERLAEKLEKKKTPGAMAPGGPHNAGKRRAAT